MESAVGVVFASTEQRGDIRRAAVTGANTANMATWPPRDILFALFLLHLTVIQSNSETNKPEVLVVLLYPFTPCDQIITAGLQFASAILVATEAVNNSSSLNFNVSVGWSDTRCRELVGISEMTDWQRTRGVHAFIGPGNQSFCATSARLAAAWNLPMVSYVSFALVYVISRSPRAENFCGRGIG